MLGYPQAGTSSNWFSQYETEINNLLQRLYDNNSNDISAKDVRDAIWTLYNQIKNVEDNAITQSDNLYTSDGSATDDVGGILKGMSFSNATIKEVLDILIKPTVAPILDIQPTSLNYQFGQSISVNANYIIEKGSHNITYRTIRFNGNNTNISTNNGNVNIGNLTYSNINVPIHNNTLSLEVGTNDGKTYSVNNVINIMNKIYFGKLLNKISNSATSTVVSNTVKVLNYNRLQSDSSIYQVINFSDEYFYYAVPTCIGLEFPYGFYVDNIFNQDFELQFSNIDFINEFGKTVKYDIWVSNNKLLGNMLISTNIPEKVITSNGILGIINGGGLSIDNSDPEYPIISVTATSSGTSSGNNMTYLNGLTHSNDIVKLGGELIEDTIIDSGSNMFTIGKISGDKRYLYLGEEGGKNIVALGLGNIDGKSSDSSLIRFGSGGGLNDVGDTEVMIISADSLYKFQHVTQSDINFIYGEDENGYLKKKPINEIYGTYSGLTYDEYSNGLNLGGTLFYDVDIDIHGNQFYVWESLLNVMLLDITSSYALIGYATHSFMYDKDGVSYKPIDNSDIIDIEEAEYVFTRKGKYIKTVDINSFFGTSSSINNIYNSDGVVTSDRNIGLGTYSMSFYNNYSDFYIGKYIEEGDYYVSGFNIDYKSVMLMSEGKFTTELYSGELDMNDDVFGGTVSGSFARISLEVEEELCDNCTYVNLLNLVKDLDNDIFKLTGLELLKGEFNMYSFDIINNKFNGASVNQHEIIFINNNSIDSPTKLGIIKLEEYSVFLQNNDIINGVLNYIKLDDYIDINTTRYVEFYYDNVGGDAWEGRRVRIGEMGITIVNGTDELYDTSSVYSRLEPSMLQMKNSSTGILTIEPLDSINGFVNVDISNMSGVIEVTKEYMYSSGGDVTIPSNVTVFIYNPSTIQDDITITLSSGLYYGQKLTILAGGVITSGDVATNVTLTYAWGWDAISHATMSVGKYLNLIYTENLGWVVID